MAADKRRNHSSLTDSFVTHDHTPEKLTDRFGPLANHPDLNLGRLLSTPYLIEDSLSDNQEQLLGAALEDYLPKTEYLATPRTQLVIGHQQVHFRPRLRQSDLLPDGTDTRFLPGPASIWQYRLWAGGSVSQLHWSSNAGQPLMMQKEVVEDIRIVGGSRPERLFVSIRKEIGFFNANVFSKSSTLPENAIAGQILECAVVERYTLCFLRQPPGTSTQAKTISPPGGALYSHVVKCDANLLFQFSALTHNAHKIHLDPACAREVYKLKAPVMHGPLMMVMMLDFLRIVLQTTCGARLQCQRMDYRNFAPLYVDEAFTLCCKPTKLDEGQPPSEAREWQVWIQTGSGDNTALIVRGTVKMGDAHSDGE